MMRRRHIATCTARASPALRSRFGKRPSDNGFDPKREDHGPWYVAREHEISVPVAASSGLTVFGPPLEG